VCEWEKIYDNDYLQSLDDLQIHRVADHYRVPPSWVRANMGPREIREWSEFQEIKQAELDAQMDG